MYFTILAQGDDFGTYPECWGENPSSEGRLVAECKTVDEVIEAIHDLGHTNYTVRDRKRHRTYAGPALAAIRELR